MIMDETLIIALALDETPVKYGYANGVGHAIMTTDKRPGADFIGGAGREITTPCGKVLDTGRIEERFTGDRMCKSCDRMEAAALTHRGAVVRALVAPGDAESDDDDEPWCDPDSMGVLALTPAERADMMNRDRRANRAVMVRPSETEAVTESEPAPALLSAP